MAYMPLQKATTQRLRPSSKINNPYYVSFITLFAIVTSFIIIATYAAPNDTPGDVNGDNLINIQDLSILLSNYGRTAAQSTNPYTDINSDGSVNVFDLSTLLSNYGKSSTGSTTLFLETFDAIKCSPDIWGTPSWVLSGCEPSAWIGDANDSYVYSVTDDRAARVGSTKDTQSVTNSRQERWYTNQIFSEPKVRESADVKPLGYVSPNPTPTYSAFTFYVRREKAQNASSFYGVSPYNIEHKRIIEKKCVGTNLGNGTLSPFETGTVSGVPYKYYSLKNSGVTTDPTFNQWHNMAVTAENSPAGTTAGTVRLTVYVDGNIIQQVDDTPGLTGCAPISAGGVGWRSDNHSYELDNFKLEQIP
jgi:hypothetical protein